MSRISAYKIWGFNDEASLSITWSASASKFNSKQAVFGYVHVTDEVAHYRLADAAPLLQFSPTGSKKAADMQLKGLLIARRDLVKAHAVAASVGPRNVWLSRNHHGIVTVADDFDDAEEAQAQAHTLAVAQVLEDALPHFPRKYVQAKTETGGAYEISDITAPMEAHINAAVLAALEYATRRRGTARSRRRDTRKRKIADREDAGTAALTHICPLLHRPTGSLLPLIVEEILE